MGNRFRCNKKGGITPTGTRTITLNGTYDVTNYASASVNVVPTAICSMDYSITGGMGLYTVSFLRPSSMSNNIHLNGDWYQTHTFDNSFMKFTRNGGTHSGSFTVYRNCKVYSVTNKTVTSYSAYDTFTIPNLYDYIPIIIF